MSDKQMKGIWKFQGAHCDLAQPDPFAFWLKVASDSFNLNITPFIATLVPL